MSTTRKQAATELWKLAKEGPSISEKGNLGKPDEYYQDEFRVWSESWLLPLLKRLVPELKDKP